MRWIYFKMKKYDVVIISKDGTLGEIININGLVIGLPKQPDKIYSRSKTKSQQYWERAPLHKSLSKIQSIFQWNEMNSVFKNKWIVSKSY